MLIVETCFAENVPEETQKALPGPLEDALQQAQDKNKARYHVSDSCNAYVSSSITHTRCDATP